MTDTRSDPPATLLIVPGLRDHVAQHWQTLLAQQRPDAVSLAPLGRDNLALAPRIDALEAAVAAAPGTVVLVAHSGGCVLVAHWAARSTRVHRVRGALLATPPSFDRPLPAGYPTLEGLDAAGWLPVPRAPLPFRTLVAASRNDALGEFSAVTALAQDWGSALEDLGAVGHLNPASGYGPWPMALPLIGRLLR
ncbi:MAG: alpha/beta hydrolase [Rhodoferax sp.]